MAFETLFPNTVLASANYTATNVGDIDNGVGSADTVYLDANGGGATQIRVGFPNPTSGIGVPVGVQTFRCSFRRRNDTNTGTGNQTVTATATLFNNGTSLAVSNSANNAGATDVTLVLTWNASSLPTTTEANIKGENVEVLIAQTAGGAGGAAASRSYVEVNEIEWQVQTRDPYPRVSFYWGDVT